jgi:hypothetical protein
MYKYKSDKSPLRWSTAIFKYGDEIEKFRFFHHFQLSLPLKIFKGRIIRLSNSFEPEKCTRCLGCNQREETPTCRDNSILKFKISKHI